MNSEKKDTTVTNNEEAPAKKSPRELYALRLGKFRVFYLLLVILSAAGLGAAIAVAVMIDLFYGALTAAISVLAYVSFTQSELNDKLGLYRKTEAGALFVTRARMRYGDELYIPSRLLWYDVEGITDSAFFSPTKKNAALRAVYLPKSLKRIGKDVFASCDSLEEIFFEGTEDEWNKIVKESSFDGLKINFEADYPQK